jgi:hypothetical protein
MSARDSAVPLANRVYVRIDLGSPFTERNPPSTLVNAAGELALVSKCGNYGPSCRASTSGAGASNDMIQAAAEGAFLGLVNPVSQMTKSPPTTTLGGRR